MKMNFFLKTVFLLVVCFSFGLIEGKKDYKNNYKNLVKHFTTTKKFIDIMSDWDIENFVELARFFEKDGMSSIDFFVKKDTDKDYGKTTQDYDRIRTAFLKKFNELKDAFDDLKSDEDKKNIIKYILVLLWLQHDKENIEKAINWLKKYPDLLFMKFSFSYDYDFNKNAYNYNPPVKSVLQYLIDDFNGNNPVVTIDNLKICAEALKGITLIESEKSVLDKLELLIESKKTSDVKSNEELEKEKKQQQKKDQEEAEKQAEKILNTFAKSLKSITLSV